MNLPFIRRALRHAAAALLPILLSALAPLRLPAQEPGTVRVAAPAQTSAGAPVPVTVELLAGEAVERAILLYRPFGTSEFLTLEVDLRGNTGTALIPASAVRPPVLEYYLVLFTRGGALTSHPFSRAANPVTDPPENLLRITVRPEGDSDTGIIFLSPDAGSVVDPEDLVVSVSLLRADTSISAGATRLLFDGADVTADAVRSEDLLVYVPANTGRSPAPGPHTVTVLLYRQDGTLDRAGSLTFIVAGAAQGLAPPATQPSALRYTASVQMESRYERLGGEGTWYNRGGLSASGTAGSWTLRGNLFVTSDERSDRQPQNRFFAGLSSPWVQLGYGDAYPSFTPLILDGKRVRGGHARLDLGVFRLDATAGQTERPIEGRLLRTISADSIGIVQAENPAGAYAPLSPTTWGQFSFGTYERSLWAVRPSVGMERDWRFGLSILKAKDDVGSITYGTRPQENLVVGSDVVVRAFHEALELTGEAAFSAFNNDISGGNFTDAYIDSVYPDRADEIRDVRNLLDNFITVNENLRPLSLSKLATAAWQVGVGLNVLDNSLRFTYLYRGSDYASFGQSYLRTDVRGFTIQDRLRLIQNTLFLSLAWERLQDNTVDIKPATTTYSTVDAVVSYYPGLDLPTVTAGLTFLDNGNALDAALVDAIDEAGTRVFVQSTAAFSAGVRHTATAGISAGSRNDRTTRNIDVRDLAASLGLTSSFTPDLQTTLEYAYSRTTRPAPPSGEETFAYSTGTLAARYGLLPGVLFLRAVVGPTFGDVERTLLGATVEWYATPRALLTLEGTSYSRPDGPGDAIASLRLRYDL
jgi:hypothetical protein